MRDGARRADERLVPMHEVRMTTKGGSIAWMLPQYTTGRGLAQAPIPAAAQSARLARCARERLPRLSTSLPFEPVACMNEGVAKTVARVAHDAGTGAACQLRLPHQLPRAQELLDPGALLHDDDRGEHFPLHSLPLPL